MKVVWQLFNTLYIWALCGASFHPNSFLGSCIAVTAVVLLTLSAVLVLCCCYKERTARLFRENGFHSLKSYDDDDGTGYAFNSRTALLSENYKDDETDSDFDVFDRPKSKNGKSYPPIKQPIRLELEFLSSPILLINVVNLSQVK